MVNSKNLLFFVGILWTTVSISFAQNANEIKIDSLAKLIKIVEGKDLGEVFHQLSATYARVDTDSAIAFAEREQQLGMLLNDSTLYAQSFNDLGVAKLFGGKFDDAIIDFNLSSAIHTRQGNYVLAAKSLNNIGAIHEHRGELELAMEAFIGALTQFESGNEKEFAAQAKNNVASIHNRLRNFDRALILFRDLERFRMAEGANAVELAYVRGNMANSMMELGKIDSAVYLYESAIEILEKSGTDKLRLPQYYVNLGQVYRESGDTKRALVAYEKGKALAEQGNDVKNLAAALLGIGIASVQDGSYQKAVKSLQESLPYLKATQQYEQFHGAHFELISAFAGANMPDSAIHYANLFRANGDSLQTNRAELAIAELETKYLTAQKEQAFAEERAARLNDQLAARERTLWLLGALGVSLLLGSVGYLLYRQQRLRNQQQLQEAELKLALTRIEAQNELQDQRLRISRDLHDNIGAQLSFIISSVDNVRFGFAEDEPKLNNKLNQLSDFAGGTVRELRDTVWAMNKDVVSIDDLRERIANFMERARGVDKAIKFRFEEDDSVGQLAPLSALSGMNAYRIMQEAVHNAIKYSDASEVVVSVGSTGGDLLLTIKDDGHGFTPEEEKNAIERGGGNGILNMRKRAREIGGSLEVISSPVNGTMVSLHLPRLHTIATSTDSAFSQEEGSVVAKT